MRLTIEAGDVLGMDLEFWDWLRAHGLEPDRIRKVEIVVEPKEHLIIAEVTTLDSEGRIQREHDDLLTHEIRVPIEGDAGIPVLAWKVATHPGG